LLPDYARVRRLCLAKKPEADDLCNQEQKEKEMSNDKVSDRYDPAVIEAIQRSYQAATAGQQSMELELPEAEVVEVVPEPKLEPKKVKAKKGRSFKEVFGWKPTHIQNVEVPLFKDEDWPEAARCMIPSVDPHYQFPKQATEYAMQSMISGDTTLVWGLKGTGKSTLPEQMCALLRIPFWRQNCNEETREQHFTGSAGVEWDDKGQMRIIQEPTLLTDSIQYGGVFCEDECFRHNSALVLQGLRESNNRRLVLPDAPGRSADERVLTPESGRWFYFMTDNTNGQGDETGSYSAQVQDSSTLDRIDSTIELGYLTRPQENKLLTSVADGDVPESTIKDMVEVAALVRDAYKTGTMMDVLSTRALLNWLRKAIIYGDTGKSFKLAWYNKLCKDDKTAVSDIYTQVTGEYL
jgi:cobaltochelatase CobS